MATLTIRNLPDDLVKRIKEMAANKGHSMEQEVRELLQNKFASRSQVLQRVQQRWESLPEISPGELEQWKNAERD